MTKITIDHNLKKVLPDVSLGVIEADVEVKQTSVEFLEEIEKTIERVNQDYALDNMFSIPKITAIRDAYKVLGKEPSRYRSSIEALLRRILQGKGLYKINNIVEINNLISLESLYSVGVYNLAKLKPPIVFRIGKTGGEYTKINNEILNIEDLPILTEPIFFQKSRRF